MKVSAYFVLKKLSKLVYIRNANLDDLRLLISFFKNQFSLNFGFFKSSIKNKAILQN
jgi:hypothetical protein